MEILQENVKNFIGLDEENKSSEIIFTNTDENIISENKVIDINKSDLFDEEEPNEKCENIVDIDNDLNRSNKENQNIEMEIIEEKDYIEDSYINKIVEKEIVENNIFDRYANVRTNFMKEKLKKLNQENLEHFENTSFIKKKSRIEIEKEANKKILSHGNIDEALIENKENNSSLLNRKMINSNNHLSLDETLIKKKSKLEIEKEAFKLLQEKKKEISVKDPMNKEMVLKLDENWLKSKQIEENNNKLTTSKSIPIKRCFICKLDGEIIKGKDYGVCGHWYHTVRYNITLEML